MGVLSFKDKTHPGAKGTKPTCHLGKWQYIPEIGVRACRQVCRGGMEDFLAEVGKEAFLTISGSLSLGLPSLGVPQDWDPNLKNP